MPEQNNVSQNNTTTELALRCQMTSYMKCGTGASAAFHLMGEGFTDFSESKNPKEYTRKYVSDKTERTDVIAYAPSYSYSVDAITGDPVVEDIMDIHDSEKIGKDAQREIVTVNNFAPAVSGAYPAFKRTFAIIPAGKGSGTDALIYTGTMKAVSDQEVGTFNPTTKVFTAATPGNDA